MQGLGNLNKIVSRRLPLRVGAPDENPGCATAWGLGPCEPTINQYIHQSCENRFWKGEHHKNNESTGENDAQVKS